MGWLTSGRRRTPTSTSEGRARLRFRPQLEVLEGRELLTLAAPQLLAPSGNAGPAPTFSWNAVTGADHYDIWVQDQNTRAIQRDTNVFATTWTVTSPLTVGNRYRWWVRAIESSGTPGFWSSPMTFVVANLGAPSLIGPSGSSVPQPTFTWNAVTGASLYDIWVQDVTTGAVERDSAVTTTSWVSTTTWTPDHSYRWWVRGIEASGVPGPWSTPLDFSPTDLAAPQLLGPSGPADPLPAFTWDTVPGAERYDIWIQNLNTGQVLRNTNVAGSPWSPDTPLAQGYSYRWWVRAIDIHGYAGPWSSPLDFTESVLDAPVLMGPSSSSSPLPTFSWNAVTGADHYDIWVRNLQTGQILRDINVGGTSWVPASPLTQGHSYRWWVRAIDDNGFHGSWSTPLEFAVAALAQPTLIGPTGPAPALPAFTWDAVTGADHYDLWLQNRRTGEIVRDQNVTATTWTPPNALRHGDAYRWWVRAVDAISSPGPWSTPLDFRVADLDAPTLIGPAVTSATLPTFSWDPVTDADHYDIWVQHRGTAVVLRDQNVTGTTWTPGAPLIQGADYRWWVRAIDSAGGLGPWSTPLDFQVDALAAPTLLVPDNAAEPLPLFTWDPVTGADHYDVWLQDRNTLQIVRDQNVLGTTWTPPSPLTVGHNYRWWVRAVDAVNSPGPWSTAKDFRVFALAAPTLIDPSGSTSSLPTFSWDPVTGADHYDVFVQNMTTSQVVRDQNVIITTWTPPDPLVVGDSYRWWVRAIDGTGAVGAWSTFLDFVVV